MNGTDGDNSSHFGMVRPKGTRGVGTRPISEEGTLVRFSVSGSYRNCRTQPRQAFSLKRTVIFRRVLHQFSLPRRGPTHHRPLKTEQNHRFIKLLARTLENWKLLTAGTSTRCFPACVDPMSTWARVLNCSVLPIIQPFTLLLLQC